MDCGASFTSMSGRLERAKGSGVDSGIPPLHLGGVSWITLRCFGSCHSRCGVREVRWRSRSPEIQVLRLRLAQEARQTTLRMTAHLERTLGTGHQVLLQETNPGNATLVPSRFRDRGDGGASAAGSDGDDLFAAVLAGIWISSLLQAYGADLRSAEQAFFRGLLRAEDRRRRSQGNFSQAA
jgi:hypothetical protein